MSKLNIDQKSINDLLSDKKADFLIPDYQRPYAWSEKECQTLWDDIFSFAFPENDCNKFNSDNDEYFLGPIVTFKNSEDKMEVIDGQQRLTTLMLLLRAFYNKFDHMKDDNSIRTKGYIEQCIWKTDEFGRPDMKRLKIDSEVATDNDKEEFLSILNTGEAPLKMKSAYSSNYRFFQDKIQSFLNEYPSYCSLLPIRILNNCILLPIEAESQDTALRIFSTLNDRGKPLSDADIFKAQFYKFYSKDGSKDEFIARWKDLEALCERIFHPIYGTPMDEIFTRYMYYERAKQGNKSSTTEALRKFYEKDSYSLLKNKEIFDNIIDLANFWNDITIQDNERFTEDILKRFFILEYAPNGMWTYIVSVYYLTNRDADGLLDNEAFSSFLDRITAFIWSYAVYNPGVNALRTPVYAEMTKIVNGLEVTFEDFKFSRQSLETAFRNYAFNNGRPITKSMMVWWAYNGFNQPLMSLEKSFEIEHIFAVNRQEKEKSMLDPKNLESLGNKAILEGRINIRASDYRFEDKKKYYSGFTTAKGVIKYGTQVVELAEMAKNRQDFVEKDIVSRHEEILSKFFKYIEDKGLMNV